jgi:hypothetical protein
MASALSTSLQRPAVAKLAKASSSARPAARSAVRVMAMKQEQKASKNTG